MSDHHVTIASPPDREKLVAMIDVESEQWAEINQEANELRIEIYPKRDGQPWVFALADVLAAIRDAKARLGQTRDSDDVTE